MNRASRNNRNKAVDIEELYTMKIGRLWMALKQEPLSLWFLCIYFFFEYVRPQTLYPVLDILPWAQLFLIASIVSAFLDRESYLTSNVMNKLFIAFILIIVLSGLLAFRPSASLDHWDVMGGWFIVYFLVTGIVNTEKRLFLFLLAYSLFNLKMSQHGAIAWTMRGFSFTSYGLNGSPGWFRNSGEYAIQMLVFGPLVLAMAISLRGYWGKYKKLFFYMIAASGYMAVIGASSRGAQIALVVVIIWFVLKQKNGFKGLMVVLTMSVVLLYLLPDEQMQRFQEMGEDENSLQRLAYWQYALDYVIPKFPVFGIGYNNWLDYVWYMVPEGLGPYGTIQKVHNIYLQATTELGIIGFVSFLLLVTYAFINNARTRVMSINFDSKLYYNVSFGLDAGLIGYLVAGSFVTVLYYPFFWVQIAMIVALNNVTRKRYEHLNIGSAGSRRPVAYNHR